MSTPTYLPNASLTRTYLRVGERDQTTSRNRRSGRLGTFWYLLSFAILVGTSLFTFVRAQPGHHPSNKQFLNVVSTESTIANGNQITGMVQPHQHQQLSESDDGLHSLDSSLSSSVKQSFQLERLAAVDLHVSLSRVDRMMQSCGGRCLDPHPGAFRAWNGAQNGCWIQVWRAWPEGCRHYQWFNSCNGYWDSYPNGAPRVFWDCCVH